ncbi:hypothetical protein GGR57DRAFT_268759 [Xylariaceae sp. FL1272]|nr:hypothetical protein GGR57DRAFT_268759 [Xylariaceae sp. FL1272]
MFSFFFRPFGLPSLLRLGLPCLVPLLAVLPGAVFYAKERKDRKAESEGRSFPFSLSLSLFSRRRVSIPSPRQRRDLVLIGEAYEALPARGFVER